MGQWDADAGKIANCQIGVFLAYAGPKGHAFLDRELYLPRSWAGDAARRSKAGVPLGGTQSMRRAARFMTIEEPWP